MRWFFVSLYTIAAVLFLGFVGWVVTRMFHLDQANYWMGRIIIWDLYAVGVIVAYTAFVGGWHLWEKLTGRMEPTADEAPGSGLQAPGEEAPGSRLQAPGEEAAGARLPAPGAEH